MEPRDRPGSTSPGTPYLDLVVGPYRLAVPAPSVLSVDQDFSPANDGPPYADLRDLFCQGPKRSRAPFAVLLEAEGEQIWAGVDGVGHLRSDQSGPLELIPSLGLRHPSLFAGALRHGDSLSLVVWAPKLVEFVRIGHASV